MDESANANPAAPGRIERKLAAIFAADMVGYSRLMESDELGTIGRQRAHRRELIDPKIAEYKGRIVKTTGDGMLVEFASVVDAAECAIAIQRAMPDRENGVAEDKRILYRIGINIGDIVIDGEDILGDGVNIAARLEGIADPGGICISAGVREQIAGKLELEVQDLGELQVKNIARPIHAYKLLAHGGQPVAAGKIPAAAARETPATEKPFIAILPLDNMSGDPGQEFFADGMTEDLITELSRFPNLSVIARNSAFTFKGKSFKVQDVARELGVRFVVEGSVRKTGDRVRITVQLIDAATGAHLWAERYDRGIADIFALQDELVRSIVATIHGRLEGAIAERVRRKPPADLTAYEGVMRARLLHHAGKREDNLQALALLDAAIERDPELASAYAWKVCVLGQAWTRGYRPASPEDWAASMELIRKGRSIDENDLEFVRILCEIHMLRKQFDEAERFHRKAYRINQNDPRVVAQRGELATWRGKAAEGVEWVEQAIRLDPLASEEWAHLLGRACFGARRYDEAARAFKNCPAPRISNCAFAAASFAFLGQMAGVGAANASLLALKPDFSARDFAANSSYEFEEDRQHLLEGLLKAGLPE